MTSTSHLKKTLFLTALLYLIIPNKVSAQDNEEKTFHPHHQIGISINHVHVFEGRDDEGNRETLTLPAWGIDYTYQFHEKWAIGLHTDFIMEKYKDQSNSLPKSFDNQVMNRYLKDIGEMAGINEDFLKVRSKGKERFEEAFKKYELITTHTARRSFASNMFKKGVPSRVIMKITGHRTEKAFSSYIKITDDENAELMLKHLENCN